jgi:hypothetical protein
MVVGPEDLHLLNPPSSVSGNGRVNTPLEAGPCTPHRSLARESDTVTQVSPLRERRISTIRARKSTTRRETA